MNLGNKIRELRLRNSITQEQLANHLSVSAQCISKWENNITMPDISLLPELSVFFGVTIDELFDLTDSAYRNRISNMLRNKPILEESEFRWAETFLKEKIKPSVEKKDCISVLAELYNHMADGYRAKAETAALEAIQLEPENKYNHSLLRMAQQGSVWDWYLSNHSKRIAYYKQFVKEHPDYERGYILLLDELIADSRLSEAESVLSQMKIHCGGPRILLYRGLIQWQRGEHEAAQTSWDEMIACYPDDFMAYLCMGDCQAKICRYDEAVRYYHKAFELQDPPRYTDSLRSIANIYEITGQIPKAIDTWEEILQVIREEHHLTEGEAIDASRREIDRLYALQR